MKQVRRKSSEAVRYEVQLGATDGFRYIGVQPPLPTGDLTHFRTAVEDGLKNSYSFVTSGFMRNPAKGQPYTEVGVMGSPDVETLTIVARVAMDAVTGRDDSFQVSEELQGIGYGLHLFGGEDQELG